MLDLTSQERRVILFLFAMALTGTGVSFLAKNYTGAKPMLYLAQNIGKVELNGADKEALMAVSGIGEKIAQRILTYRRENGNFTSVSELKKIKGVNGYRFEKIKDSVYVR